jgi:hypothetical protein
VPTGNWSYYRVASTLDITGAFTEDEIDLAKVLAQQASVVIDNFRLHEQIERLAPKFIERPKTDTGARHGRA